MEADKYGVRGVMKLAHINMRNTSVNCPAPLTQYERDLGERMCGSSSHIPHPPFRLGTCVCVMDAGSFCHGHVHEFHFSQYMYDLVHNDTSLGSVTQRAKLCPAVVYSRSHLHQTTHSLWRESKQHNVHLKSNVASNV